MNKQTVGITETVLRDGQQSLIATRMPIDDMLPILEKLDRAGYHALEVWGGATFDTCLRYLNEDPWERLRQIRQHAPNTPLQMLLRGQNILGYKNYADDVVEKFVEKSISNGIDIIRMFDALNDTRNLKTALKATKKYGGHAQMTISYTTSDFHTIPYYVQLAKEMEIMGADSLCIKDMAGILTPQRAYDLVSELKASLNIPIEIHTHATSGIADMTYIKAVEAGADIIDTASSPFAGGTSQPATESMLVALRDLGYDVTVDATLAAEIAEYFAPIRDRFRHDGGLNPKVMDVQPKSLRYQVPGGMLSNLLAQLKDQGQEALYEQVLNEVPKVRADLGYPPLVTPLSQMVGTQALMNVMSGERYKLIPNEIKDYVCGQYGRPPVPIATSLVQKIIGDEQPITSRPADHIAPQFKQFETAIGDYAHSVEDVLIYGLFPDQGRDFLGRREDRFYDVPIQNITVDFATK
ncbi:oxaloacetate decarboxylase subunit alpha [Lactiplantibacillus pentosus]|uniref:oxaloacetate decarboxylase subunit alpha n=1 Tax=Lactiplantibacillus pentosus TaxID=1589 RepID=UPI001ADD937C|nr:oxaloacetate decarboxylase subunit alpha [Lactiplantibacillus pentosus]MBO9164564.1 oxaloacetate decarboxylase subunit alpha [Lactiplantibacillus pentosus]MCT3310736.1 oxaloacetate decarboxylase subunit alpha [Lactiplantibacillus pentosus]